MQIITSEHQIQKFQIKQRELGATPSVWFMCPTPHLPQCILGSDRTPPASISGRLREEGKRHDGGAEMRKCPLFALRELRNVMTGQHNRTSQRRRRSSSVHADECSLRKMRLCFTNNKFWKQTSAFKSSNRHITLSCMKSPRTPHNLYLQSDLGSEPTSVKYRSGF